jgi:bacteriocin-like protein
MRILSNKELSNISGGEGSREINDSTTVEWKVTVKVKVNPAVIPPIFKRKQTSTASSGGGGGSSSVSYLTQN